MKLSETFGLQLPKINLKKFDNFCRDYESIRSVSDPFKQSKSLLRTAKPKQISSEKYQQEFKKQNKCQKSISLLNHLQSNPKIPSRSVSFFKSLSRSQLMETPIQKLKQQSQTISLDKKTSIRQIDSKFVLESIPRLKVSKSEPKLEVPTHTKYENWYPKKNKIREIENIKHQNYLKLQKLQDSFFFKCRNTNNLLKLTKSQQIKY